MNLLKKEMFGMRLKNDYSILSEKIINLFENVFRGEMIFVNKQEAYEHMGLFKLKFKYIPLKYDVIFESERNVFCIDIFDEEGAKNTLYRLQKYNNGTNLENIEIALSILKTKLEENDFCLYIFIEDKIYKKKNNQYKIVEDLTELMR